MKGLIKSVIFIIISILACIGIYLCVLECFVVNEEDIDYTRYENAYYYKQLNNEEKEIYIQLDYAINDLEKVIHLGFLDKYASRQDVENALDAIYKDRPEYYFLPQQYYINSIPFFDKAYMYVKMEYTVKDDVERKEKDRELELAINQIVYEATTSNMTDVEKQIAIHDRFLEKVTYYDYTDINNIPYSKHTSYEALVNNEAVCDGVSRAMMLILNKVGIETILVSGKVNNTPHAWNIIKLENEYYHMDATSNKVDFDSKKYIIHKYFNITDEEISETHTINYDYVLPKCTGTKYNYYLYKDFYIDYLDNMKNKLVNIINKQYKSNILELKIDELYAFSDLLETLYFVDFNNWHTTGKTSVSYHNLGDIYVFKNENTRRINY